MGTVEEIASRHVAEFNSAVASRDFTRFLAPFDDDAVMRFENVPGAGVLEFVGRPACAAAYAQQPPDDQIGIAGPVRDERGTVVIPFVWLRDGGRGVLRLVVADGRISRMVVTFV